MKRMIMATVIITALLLTLAASAQRVPGTEGRGQENGAGPAKGNWIVPNSSVERPEDAGKFAHTNYVFPLGFRGGRTPAEAAKGAGPNFTYDGETPQSLGCLYKIPGSTGTNSGCVPTYGTGGPQSGGWGIIALVDAYDNPDAASDIAAFDSYWGLPAASFTKVYANGNGDCSTPPPNAGWSVEESLDIEYAHVFAPKAAIYLVEACSNSYTDLLYAEYVAGSIINGTGGDISNSWGSGEFSGETSDDPYFGVYYFINTAYFASAGDSGCGAAYPSSSPWLVSAGGSQVDRKSNGKFKDESCWNGSGGGTSSQETWQATWAGGGYVGPWADYQYPIFGEAARSTPDFAADASCSSPVWIYNAYAEGGWALVCGTSVASPSLAGIVNNAANKLGTGTYYLNSSTGFYTAEEDNLLYSQLGTATAYPKNFYDVTTGSNGCTVAPLWDYCTGVGTPRALLGK